MPNDNSTMGERFDEEFPHPDVRGIFEGGDPYQMRRNAIKSFVQSEISRAVGERRKINILEAIEIVEECGHQQDDDSIWCDMDEVIKKLKALITKQS